MCWTSYLVSRVISALYGSMSMWWCMLGWILSCILKKKKKITVYRGPVDLFMHPRLTTKWKKSSPVHFWQLHVFTRSSLPTSVKPSFPAWKALRVNSPASAGLMPGTLPEKHTQKTHTAYKHDEMHEARDGHASHTHTNTGGSNAGSMCHSRFTRSENRHNCAG